MEWNLLITPITGQPMPWFCGILALLTAWLLGFTRSGLGAGGFVVSPLMVLALGGQDGLAVVAVVMIPAGVVGCWQHRKEIDHKLLRPLMPAAVFGTALGALALWLLVSSGKEASVHRHMEFLVAVLSLIYVFLVIFRKKIAHWHGGAGPLSTKGVFVTGSALALSQTVANSGSPLFTVYFVRHGLKKAEFVSAQNFFLLAQNTLKMIPLILLGILHLNNAALAFMLIPVTFLGSWNGKQFYKIATDKIFFMLYVILLILGFISSALLIWGRHHFFALLSG